MSNTVTSTVVKKAAIILLVAATYWIAAKLALLLVLQPGYATAVWPAAGVALGAALVWRSYGIAGAALGALAWNLTRLLDWPGADDAIRTAIQSLGVTCGVILQAAIGSWLIVKAIGSPITLLRDHHVMKFMVIAGPLSCLISSTVGVGVLSLAGTLSGDQILFSWFTWWVGDSIGVLTVTPIVLMFFGEPAELWRHRRLSIGLPMAVTFAVAVVAFLFSSQADMRRQQDQLERRADEINLSFHARLENAAGLVRSCDGFYQSSETVTDAEFGTFARTLLHENSGVIALSHVERVQDKDRADFEAQMRAKGYPDFAIREVTADAKIAVARKRDVYDVVTNIEPIEPNRVVLGVDIQSREQSMRAANRAIETGSFVVSEPVALIQDAEHRFGVAMYLPGFAKGLPTATTEQRHAAFRGLNGAVVQLDSLVGASTSRSDLPEFTLLLQDVTDSSSPQLLYEDGKRASLGDGERVHRAMEIGGRIWQLTVSRVEGYSIAHQSIQSWFVLAGGLMLTSLLGGLLMILTGRATLIASLVRDRTRELSLTNTRLAEEQAVSQHMMRELKASRDAAEEADRTKTAFLANMSHEIRTPMTAILGYTDLLIDPHLTPQIRGGYAEVIRRNGEHLLEVVNDILDISKIEAGKLAVELIPTSLDEIIRDIQNMMQPRAQQKGIEFSVQWKGDTSRWIRTDPIRVRQILINLVSNAIKFTESGGVTLRVERSFDSIEVDVFDTGIGMEPTQFECIFEPFTQGDSTMTRRFGGTGLGLAISRHLSRLLGGDLGVRSELGKGSVFTLRLPAIDVPESELVCLQEPARESLPKSPVGLRGKRVLLAEDSNDVREFLKQVLIQAGIEVTSVIHGEELLHAALHGGNGRFDLLLVDMQMPLVDGYECARRLRAAGITIPLLAITAHTLESDRTACLRSGCSDYIRKPVRRHVLLQRIAVALGVNPFDSDVASDIEPIHSELEDDPIIADLLPVFMTEMQRYAASLREAVGVENETNVRQLLHNVKGAAATFGFPQLGELAGAASAEMRSNPWSEKFHSIMSQFYEVASKVQCRPRAVTQASGDSA